MSTPDFIDKLNDAKIKFFEKNEMSEINAISFEANKMKCNKEYIYSFISNYFNPKFLSNNIQLIDGVISYYFASEEEISSNDYMFDMDELTTFISFLVYYSTKNNPN